MPQKRPAPPPPPGREAAPPPHRRLRIDAAAGHLQRGASSEASAQQPAPPATTSPRSWQLLQTSVLVLFFVVRVKEERRCNLRLRRVVREEIAISQKRPLESIMEHLNAICCSVESLARRIDILRNEVEQIKQSNPNHRANDHYRSKENQDYAVLTEEVNQEQTVIRFAASEAQEAQGVQLRFLNKLKPVVYYTKDKIKAEDGTDIKIAIFRDNQRVTSGPLSLARIEILALCDKFNVDVPDNWTESQFDNHRVSSSKGEVLGGDCQVKLKNGEASLSNIFFDVPSSKTGSEKFILAARVHHSDKAGLRIKEAVLNPVEVQVSRNKSNKKSDRPKLNDKVHRLKGIGRTGVRAKWLEENKISTVEDFKKAVNKDEEKICTECFKLNKDNKSWRETVEHAEECDLEGNCKLKSYIVQGENIVLFFNCVHDLVGAKFGGLYVKKCNFNSDQQNALNRLRKQAYDELDNIGFDHEMKDNYPVPLSSILNTSIGDDASIPFTYSAAPSPPSLHVTYQVQGTAAVETAHPVESNHAHELRHAFANNNVCGFIMGPSVQEQIPFEQHGLHGYQGNQAVAVTLMGPEYPQFYVTDMEYYIASEAPGVITEGISSGDVFTGTNVPHVINEMQGPLDPGNNLNCDPYNSLGNQPHWNPSFH